MLGFTSAWPQMKEVRDNHSLQQLQVTGSSLANETKVMYNAGQKHVIVTGSQTKLFVVQIFCRRKRGVSFQGLKLWKCIIYFVDLEQFSLQF